MVVARMISVNGLILFSILRNIAINITIICYTTIFILLLTVLNMEQIQGKSENYTVMKIVPGSFHQGDPKFHESAGLQCGINCIVSTCFSVAKKISSWNQSDLDYILETGNEYFKNNGYTQYLALDELPIVVDIDGYVFNLSKMEDMKTIDMNIATDSRLFWGSAFSDCLKISQAVICVTCDVIFMIRKESNYYYVFDSHSRSSNNGEPCDNGYSVLMKFKNLNELTNYVKYIYLVKREKESVPLQMQFYNCELNESDKIEFNKSLQQNQKKNTTK